MKVFHKIAAFILLLLFAAESFGISRYAHFCGGEVTSESYFIQKKDCCCDEAEEAEMSDCCKDEIKVVQNINEQILAAKNSTSAPKIDFVSVFYSIHSNTIIAPLVNSTFTWENKINQSFDTSPPIRELACCFII